MHTVYLVPNLQILNVNTFDIKLLLKMLFLSILLIHILCYFLSPTVQYHIS